MKARIGFAVIEGGKAARSQVRQNILLGGAAFAIAFVAVLAFLFSPWPVSDFRPSAASSPTATAARLNLRVIDGDTVEDRTSGARYRLANIDTPETGSRARCAAERRLGNEATAAARLLVRDARSVEISPSGRIDKYGRTIAYVSVDGRDLGETLISRDLARRWGGRREPWCGGKGGLIR